MRYRDQFLALHRISVRKYELSYLRTGSVRDQILRATLLAERLALNGRLIRPRNPKFPNVHRGLLVLGGGAAGVAAALTAAEAGVDVTIVEKSKGSSPELSLFNKQRSVRTRRIDPCEYDWPWPWWRPEIDPTTSIRPASIWPKDPADGILEIETASPSDLAILWEDIFLDWLRDNSGRANGKGEISIVDDVDATSLQYKEGNSSITVVGLPHTASVTEFGAAVSCIGFGDEAVKVTGVSGQTFHGMEFWSTDSFEAPFCGIRSKPDPVRALVSGSGDGAQQDLQRLLTGSFGRDLYERIEDVLGRSLLEEPELFLLASAEDRGKRAHAWKASRVRVSKALAEWQQTYFKVIDTVWHRLNDLETQKLRSLIIRNGIKVTWLMRNSDPDYCFGLNRFLTFFLLYLLHSKDGILYNETDSRIWTSDKNMVICDHFLSNIESADLSDLSKQASAHHAPKHVWVSSTTSPRPQLGSSDLKDLGIYEVVIIRHGVEGKSLFGTGAPIPEQLAPYDFPR